LGVNPISKPINSVSSFLGVGIASSRTEGFYFKKANAVYQSSFSAFASFFNAI
jgi:hypothetical protein